MSSVEFMYKKSRYKVPARFFGKIARVVISHYEFSVRWEKVIRKLATPLLQGYCGEISSRLQE